jgi:predicted alpha/beta superfamily hydrolase
MTKKLYLLLFFIIGFNQANSQEVEQLVIGSKHVLHSEILGEDREYWISLPYSYHDPNSTYKSYPVLILLDGNIHFRAVSGMVDYMSSDVYGNRKIPEMIIVGIQNVDRRRDYTPEKIVTVRENNTGGGERFLSFLESELIPALDQKYRTEPYRILFGHSLGGLLAAHAYLKEKTLFNSFIAVDPSFGTWDSETMDQKLDILTEHPFDRFIYLATANWGKRNIRNRDRHVRFYESLHSKSEGDFLAKLDYFEEENHNSVPLIAFHHGINAIFEGYGISFREVQSIEYLTQHFQRLSTRLSWEISPPEHLVNQVGYTLLQNREEQVRLKALDFFVLNTENYPGSFNAFHSLGEAYEALGNTSNAVKNYQKSLELNPTNTHAQRRLEELAKNK